MLCSFMKRFAAYTESEFLHEDFTHLRRHLFVSLDTIYLFYALMFFNPMDIQHLHQTSGSMLR